VAAAASAAAASATAVTPRADLKVLSSLSNSLVLSL
jgi:hypothetical protein